MEALATTEVARQRAERLEHLNDQIEAGKVKAAALDALVAMIAEARVPVARYEPVWRAVEDRLRKDAALAHRDVTTLLAHVVDVQRAIEAREAWTPTRSRDAGPDAVGG